VTRDAIIRGALSGCLPQASASIIEYVTASLTTAGANREEWLAALRAIGSEVAAIAAAVAERAGQEGTGQT